MDKSPTKDRDRPPTTTPLHLCATEKIARRLVASGADVHARDFQDQQPIHYAKDPQLVSYLLEEHKKNAREWEELSNWQDRFQTTPLHQAMICEYDPEAIAILAQELPTCVLEAIDSHGDTALHILAKMKDAAAIALILPKFEALLSDSVLDTDGRTSLECAISKKNEVAVKLFLEHGIQLYEGRSLEAAIISGNINITEMVFNELDPSALNCPNEDHSMTPLHVAVECGSIEVADLLVGWGADISIEDNEGKVPADYIDTQETREATVKRWKEIQNGL